MAARRDDPGEPGALRDLVDDVVAGWAAVRPDLDVSPIEVITRLARLRAYIDGALSEVFSRYDLSNADFAVMAHLGREGPPHRLSQSTLTARLGLTSGTISVRIHRLVAKGIVDRAPDPDDARGVLITLTNRGRELFDVVAPVHLANEHRLLSALDPENQRELARLLRVLLLAFEHPEVTSPLGVSVAPAHVARGHRARVGLRDEVGLLVTHVVPGGPAATAGIDVGDLLVSLDGRPLQSTETLAGAGSAGGAEVEFLRGDSRRRTTVRVGAELAGSPVMGSQPDGVRRDSPPAHTEIRSRRPAPGSRPAPN